MSYRDENQYNGLSFWKVIFIMGTTWAFIYVGGAVFNFTPVEFFSGVTRAIVPPDTHIHKSHFERVEFVEPACGRPIVLEQCPALVDYERDFLREAAAEAEMYKAKIPHLLQLVADYRTYRRAQRAGNAE